MTSCCDARGCDEFFTSRMAKRAAARYRKKGVDKTAQRMLAFLEEQGIEGRPSSRSAAESAKCRSSS